MRHRLNANPLIMDSFKSALTKSLACVLILTSSTAFKVKTAPSFGDGLKDKDGKKLITIKSEEFKSFTRRIHQI